MPGSGNDVGKENILDAQDPVPEIELALFQPFDLKMIGEGNGLQRPDGAVEIPVFFLQQHELTAQFLFVRIIHENAAYSPWVTGKSGRVTPSLTQVHGF